MDFQDSSWKISVSSLVILARGGSAVLGIFIWVGQSKAEQIFGRPTEVVYVEIMETRAVWVGQERVWVGHGPPGARTASDPSSIVQNPNRHTEV